MDAVLASSKDVDLRGGMGERGELSFLCDFLSSSSDAVGRCRDAATALRNACDHEDNVRHLLRLDVLVTVQRSLQAIVASGVVEEGGNPAGEAATAVVVVLLCQMVANMTACGAESSVHIWAVHRSDLFRDMVAASSKLGSRKAFASTLAAVYNGLCHDPSIMGHFTGSRALLCQVLLTAIVSSRGQGQGQTDDPALEWLHRIVAKCMEKQALTTIFTRLGARHPAAAAAPENVWDNEPAAHSLETGATHEQVIWLQAVQAVLEDGMTVTSFAPGGDVWVLLHTLSQQLALLMGLVQRGREERQQNPHGEKESATEGPLRLHLLETGVLSMLGTISAGLAAVTADSESADEEEQDRGRALQQSLAATTDIIPTCVSLLGQIKPSSQAPPSRREATAAAAPVAAPVAATSSAFSKEVENEIVKAALALLGNLAYRCPAAQDAFRSQGGFLVVLPRCATSFSNPLEREWAHVCVRNVLEDNPTSIAFVESLQPQGVHSTVAGLDLEIDAVRGVFRFTGQGQDT